MNHTYLRIPYSVCMIQHQYIQVWLARVVDSDVFNYFCLMNLLLYAPTVDLDINLTKEGNILAAGMSLSNCLLRFH